jgi:hypothetical protein
MSVPASTAIKLPATACAGVAVVCRRLDAAGRRADAAAQAVRPSATRASGGDDHRPDARLGYLRALQRKVREMLAPTAPEELSRCRWDDVGSLDVR